MPYAGGGVVGTMVSPTPRRALFLVGGQFRRSRSAQAVSDAKNTNRIRLLRIMQGRYLQQEAEQVKLQNVER